MRALFGILALSGCATSSSEPTSAVSLTFEQPLPEIVAGATSTIRVSVANDSERPVYLIYPTCQMPFELIKDAEIIVPSGLPCATVAGEPELLSPGSKKTIAAVWRGEIQGKAQYSLEPGEYRIRPVVQLVDRKIVGDAVTIRVAR